MFASRSFDHCWIGWLGTRPIVVMVSDLSSTGRESVRQT